MKVILKKCDSDLNQNTSLPPSDLSQNNNAA